jgi:hypothetical protein
MLTAFHVALDNIINEVILSNVKYLSDTSVNKEEMYKLHVTIKMNQIPIRLIKYFSKEKYCLTFYENRLNSNEQNEKDIHK